MNSDENVKFSELDKILLKQREKVFNIMGNGAPISVISLYIMASIKRIETNVSGFKLLASSAYYPIIGAIIRMQIDTAMRLNGLNLMRDKYNSVGKLLEGMPFDQILHQNGSRLRDKLLLSELTKQHSWVERVYRKTSGLIHLSDMHVLHALDFQNGKIQEDGNLAIDIVMSQSAPELPPGVIAEALEGFTHATAMASALAMVQLEHETSRLVREFPQ